ncbi:MAG: (Fe-S)-binding protein [Pirellulales bacterium]
MSNLLPSVDTAARSGNPGAGIDYDLFLDCIHCGLCTSSCPTYTLTGNENDGPRGRIHLMRAVTDERIPLTDEVRHHLELCLDCRGCETACPSGVQYGRLIEPFRAAMENLDPATSGAAGQASTPDWFTRWILRGLFPYKARLTKALWPARIAQRLGLLTLAERTGALRLLPQRLRRLTEMLPPAAQREATLPEFLPAIGRRRARVALFTGCVGDVMFRGTNWATARVLQRNGCDVLTPAGQGCCGAIHYHSGASEPAQRLADANARVFRADEVDAVIVNIAGCGAMLKDYPHHWHDDGSPARNAFAAKVRDIHEFLDQLGPVRPTGELPIAATYHDACHLAHAQKIREAPRRLLRVIPGLELTRDGRIGSLLRRGRHLQPDAARDGGCAGATEAGPVARHPGVGGGRGERRLLVANPTRSPASGRTVVDRASDGFAGRELPGRESVRARLERIAKTHLRP